MVAKQRLFIIQFTVTIINYLALTNFTNIKENLLTLSICYIYIHQDMSPFRINNINEETFKQLRTCTGTYRLNENADKYPYQFKTILSVHISSHPVIQTCTEGTK